MECNHRLHSQRWWPRLMAKKDSHSLRELAEEFGAAPGAINTNLKCYTNNPPPLKTRRGRPHTKTSTDTNTNNP